MIWKAKTVADQQTTTGGSDLTQNVPQRHWWTLYSHVRGEASPRSRMGDDLWPGAGCPFGVTLRTSFGRGSRGKRTLAVELCLLSARQLPKRRPLVHRDMIGLVALDLVLRVILAGVDRVTLKRDSGRNDSGDAAADTAGLRIPTHVISALETRLCHWMAPLGSSVLGS
jgi:hypothetical protein